MPHCTQQDHGWRHPGMILLLASAQALSKAGMQVLELIWNVSAMSHVNCSRVYPHMCFARGRDLDVSNPRKVSIEAMKTLDPLQLCSTIIKDFISSSIHRWYLRGEANVGASTDYASGGKNQYHEGCSRAMTIRKCWFAADCNMGYSTLFPCLDHRGSTYVSDIHSTWSTQP